MSPAAVEASSAPPQSVLVLDDDRFMLEMLSDMLAGFGGFEVFTESDARQALAALPRCRPAVLICDLVLPGMDGIEFLQAAASRGFAGKVILLSGTDPGVRDAASELARVLGLNVTGSFRKPVAAQQLRRAVSC